MECKVHLLGCVNIWSCVYRGIIVSTPEVCWTPWVDARDSLVVGQIESCYTGTRVITGDAGTRCCAFWEFDCCRGFSSSSARSRSCHSSFSIDVASITLMLTLSTVLVSEHVLIIFISFYYLQIIDNIYLFFFLLMISQISINIIIVTVLVIVYLTWQVLGQMFWFSAWARAFARLMPPRKSRARRPDDVPGCKQWR